MIRLLRPHGDTEGPKGARVVHVVPKRGRKEDEKQVVVPRGFAPPPYPHRGKGRKHVLGRWKAPMFRTLGEKLSFSRPGCGALYVVTLWMSPYGSPNESLCSPFPGDKGKYRTDGDALCSFPVVILSPGGVTLLLSVFRPLGGATPPL